MSLSRWLALSAVGFLLITVEVNSAIAQTSPDSAEPIGEDVAPQLEPEAAVNAFEIYTLPNTFSLEIPQGWLAVGTEADGYAVITSYFPDTETLQVTDIKTEVTLVEESPKTFVGREIDELIQQGHVIDQYGMTAVGGNQAFRLWISELSGDFTNQVITFVGNEDSSTARIVSYFNDESETTRQTLLQIHRSFEFQPKEE